MLTLVLTRHGSTLRSDPEQHLGQRLDLPLSDLGRSAAVALGGRLAGLRFDRVVTSPLQRSRETAALVVPGAAVERDPRLIEMDYGRWEGLTYDEIEAADAEARRRWEADPARLHCPGGESGDEVAARVTSFLADLLVWSAAPPARVPEDVGRRRVLLVSHSSTNRVLLCVAMGVALRDYRRRFVQEPANLTVLSFDRGQGPGARLLVANDVSHLRGIRGDTWG